MINTSTKEYLSKSIILILSESIHQNYLSEILKKETENTNFLTDVISNVLSISNYEKTKTYTTEHIKLAIGKTILQYFK